MKYAWMEKNKLLWPACAQCRVLGVSASGQRAKDAALDRLLWYNGSRMHSTLRYLSPTRFEQQAEARKRDLAA